MTDDTTYWCNISSKNIEFIGRPIQCEYCLYWFHGKCQNLSKNEWLKLGRSNCDWFCKECTRSMLPFASVNDDELLQCLYNLSERELFLRENCNDLDAQIKELNVKCGSSSRYITPEKLGLLNDKIASNFSLIHFNCRSLNKHFEEISLLLESNKFEFKVIALTETWLNVDKCDSIDNFKIENFSNYFCNRKSKKGGGTALYISNTLQHEYSEALTYSIEDIFEGVTLEIKINCLCCMCV